MYYAVARLEFLIPHSQSLKEKRAVLNRLKARIVGRFHVAVAEVDHQDLWQRAALGVALVALGPASARNALEAIRRETEADPRVMILDYEMKVARLGDESGDELDDEPEDESEDEPGGEPVDE